MLTGDIKRLSALPGIGKKTAERLVLELKDKINPARRCSRPVSADGARRPAGSDFDPLADVLSALVNLGYKEHPGAQGPGNHGNRRRTPRWKKSSRAP
ncbi:MAG: helix-hairpin-helix domain-containing protein [Comamonadaceae bacterium]|nr:helix-hairpin-helix domain-containing protein [Comamonadaceae bacterium]